MFNYKFSPNISSRKILFIKVFDWITNFFKRTREFDISSCHSITIVQLAHIGDLMLTLPALKKIKMLINIEVNLVVSSGNFDIASKVPFIDNVNIVDAPYFLRGKKGSYLTFIRQLRKIKTDMLFDIRGDLRNNIFLSLFTKKKIFLGYDVGGGGAFVDKILPYPFGLHISNLCNPLIDLLNISEGQLSRYWNPDEIPYAVVPGIEKEKYMVVHLGVGAPARKWPIDKFKNIIFELSKSHQIYLLGSNNDISLSDLNNLTSLPNVKSGVGKLSLLESIYVVKNSYGFLGLDSGFTHIAALLGVKVFVLFSGMADVNVWKPFKMYENQIFIINKTPPCSLTNGCGRLVCDDNICMKEISSNEVLSMINLHMLPMAYKNITC